MLNNFKRIIGFLFFWRKQINMYSGNFLLEDHSNKDGSIVTIDYWPSKPSKPATETRDIAHALNFVMNAIPNQNITDIVDKALNINNVCWGDVPIITVRQKIVFYVLSKYSHTISNQKLMVDYLYDNCET